MPRGKGIAINNALNHGQEEYEILEEEEEIRSGG